jgi:hypothetical protein
MGLVNSRVIQFVGAQAGTEGDKGGGGADEEAEEVF